MKIVVERESGKILSVHIIGSLASELIHIGEMALEFEATYDFFLRAVMNYPTLSRVYKVAAYDILANLGRS